MKAKEKARELVDKFYFSKDEDGYHSMNRYRAKQCALIAVDEILNSIPMYLGGLNPNWKFWQ